MAETIFEEGIPVNDKSIPFEGLAYATTDISVGKNGNGLVLYGLTGMLKEINMKMDKKREFNEESILPEIDRRTVESMLKGLSGESVIQDLGNGRYRANETVYIKRGEFSKKAPVRIL